MPATRIVWWGSVAVLLLVVSSLAYVGANATQASSYPQPAGPTYNVTFSETGLAPGTNWSVSVTGAFAWGGGWHWGWNTGWHWGWERSFRYYETSNTSSITFALTNGTYRYHVHEVPGYNVSSGARGTFNVSGASPPTIDVSFSVVVAYAVTFTETGLPTGTNWTVHVSPIGPEPCRGYRYSSWQTSSSASIAFSLPNGTYRYYVPWVPGYGIADNGSYGTFNVTGASPPTIQIHFVPIVTYTVTFTETGLPSGTNWSVAVVSVHGWGEYPGVFLRQVSNESTISFSLANGTYAYFVGPVHGYSAGNSSFGTFNVTGASPAPISVTFVACTWGTGSAEPSSAVYRA